MTQSYRACKMAASRRRESFLMRKILISFTIGIILICNTVLSIFASGPMYDIQQLSSGLVKVSYASPADRKIKIAIEKDGTKVYYNLNNDGIAEGFPLQFGNGDYEIKVYENISGVQYKQVSSENVLLNLNDEKLVYLHSIQNINWDGSMLAIQKARELTGQLNTDFEKINAIYRYIIDNILYDHGKMSTIATSYIPDINETFKSGKGICYDFSSLFAAMLRSAGIPAKLVKGYTDNAVGYHAWNEVYDSTASSWVIIDTTYDSQIKASGAAFTMIKNSGSYSKLYEY